MQLIQTKFKLKKVTLKPDGTADVQFCIIQNDEQGEYLPKVNQETPRQRHPDLDKAIDKLRYHLARIYGHIGKPATDFASTIKMLSVTFTGEEGTGIIMAGDKKIEKRRVPVQSWPVSIDDELYDEGKQVHEIGSEIITEAYRYIYKQKFGDAELFDAKLQAV